MFCNICRKEIESTESYCEIHLACCAELMYVKIQEEPLKLKIEEEDIKILESVYPIGMDSDINSKYRKVLHKLIAMRVLQQR